MEHKLILGGQQWLPFARSQIEALRLTGLQHASRIINMPDGATVTVRIVGEDEFIKLEGGGEEYRMDSGLVEAFNAGSLAYSASTLYECGEYQTPYHPWDAKWRKKLKYFPRDSEGQLAGIVSLTPARAFEGKVPYDGQPARSLSPGKVKNNDGTAYITNTVDDLLATKKAILKACPASMFTGRCRLYVQAMYGRFLYKDDLLDTVTGEVISPGAPTGPLNYEYVSGGAPALRLTAYKSSEDKLLPADEAYDSVTITTSSGVYYDTTTRTHWLINMGSGVVAVYPLIGTLATEALREYLPGGKKKANFTADDFEHLEANILSTCLPRTRAVQVSTVTSVPTSAMGYGWHWNWYGDEAHIVSIESRSDTPEVEGTYYQISTHYKRHALVTWNEIGPVMVWSTSVVEGPTNWSVFRANWCFTQPLWSAQDTHAKVTPKVAPIFNCDAPFYVFYKRNELQVCRIKVEALGVDGPTSTATDYFGPLDSEEWTLGMQGGYRENTSDGMSSVYHGTYYKATLTVGSTVITDLTVGLLRNGTRHEVKDKVINNYTAGFLGSNYDHMQDQPYGDPTGFIPGVYAGDWAIGQFFFGAGVYRDQFANMNYTYESCDVTDSRTDLLTVIIPWYDAEAIFVRASATRNYLKSGITREVWGKLNNSWVIGSHVLTRVYDAFGVVIDFIHQEVIPKYAWSLARPGGIDALSSSTNPPDELTTTVLQDNRKLFCHAGAVDVDFTDGNLADFHDNELDEVVAVYNVTSGISTAEPVVLSNQRITPVGTHGHDAVRPALLGWI